MPVEQGCWLHDHQGLPPVKPAGEPDKDEAGGISDTLRLCLVLLVQRQSFSQKQVFCCKSSRRTQTKQEKMDGSDDKRAQHNGKVNSSTDAA